MDDDAKLAVLILVSVLVTPVVLLFLFLGVDVLDLEPDLVTQVILLGSTVPFIVMGVWMALTGKGAFLVAGYNTATAAEKAMYDEEAMAKAVGLLVSVSLIFMLASLEFILVFESSALFWVFLTASIAVIVGGLYHVNTSPRIKKPGELPPKDRPAARKRGIHIAVAVLASVAVLVAVFVVLPFGDVEASLGDEALSVSGPMMSVTIAYEDIDSAELRTEMDLGMRTFGYSGGGIGAGKYKNAEFGSYELACHSAVGAFIVVDHGGKTLVFNLGSVAETEAFHDELQLRLAP